MSRQLWHENSVKYQTAADSRGQQADEASERNWLNLPNDVLREILVCLDGLFLLSTAPLVCKLWHGMCKDDTFLWKKIYLATYGTECVEMWHRVAWRKEFGVQQRWRYSTFQEEKIYSSKQNIKSRQFSLGFWTASLFRRCLSFNGDRLAACTKNRFKLWNLTTGRSICDVDIPAHCTTCLGQTDTIHPDMCWNAICRLAFCGNSLALGTGQGEVIMYCYSTTVEHVFTAVVRKSVVTCIAMDDEIVVAGSLDGTLTVLDKCHGSWKFRLCAHQKQIWCLQIDERYIFSGSGDCAVKVWSRDTGACLHVLRDHTGPVYSLAIRENMLATGSYDGTIRLWDMRIWASVLTLHGHTRAVRSVSLNRMQVASAGWDGKIHVWDILNGEMLRTVHVDDPPILFVVLMNSKVISCGDDGVIRSWKLNG